MKNTAIQLSLLITILFGIYAFNGYKMPEGMDTPKPQPGPAPTVLENPNKPKIEEVKEPETSVQTTVKTPDIETLGKSTYPDNLLTIIQAQRASAGCKYPLKYSTQLTKAAQERAQYTSEGHWSHDGYTATVSKYYSWKQAGEILARFYNTDNEILTGWLNSPTHKAVMLDCRFREVGIGRYNTYVSVIFGIR